MIKLNIYLSISDFCFLGEIYLVTLRCFEIIANKSGAVCTRSGSVFEKVITTTLHPSPPRTRATIFTISPCIHCTGSAVHPLSVHPLYSESTCSAVHPLCSIFTALALQCIHWLGSASNKTFSASQSICQHQSVEIVNFL